ncbi:MAG: winged helix-turn-helix transcriptional regulator [Eubacterium sp.]|jgi:Protein involved in cell division|nr:winged helix-turn-helix transcriptional regulator [Eubacterium sp.]
MEHESAGKAWQFDLEPYLQQGEPEKAEKTYAWSTAIGLQDVDGLETSTYLLQTAKEHIEGSIDMDTAQHRIESYYQSRENRREAECETEEADKVAARIARELGEKTFQFSPAEYLMIHRRLFLGIYDHAGKIRPYNITKQEWVLQGETVLYASADSIQATLEYDFQTEKQFSYQELTLQESVRHLAKFTSDIWQIHPFCEGNTRTTAVFIIKYLKTFGFTIQNEAFSAHSWYFRNALVRANYNNLKEGIYATTEYLEKFFDNLLLGTNHALRNRDMHVAAIKRIQSARIDVSKCNICTLEELAVLNMMKEEPKITQKELSARIGKSERTIKKITISLQQKGLVKRESGKRNGRWTVCDP